MNSSGKPPSKAFDLPGIVAGWGQAASAGTDVEYALDLDVIDPESLRVILDYRADRPVELFPLDGRLHLHGVRVETTDVAAYNCLLTEVAS